MNSIFVIAIFILTFVYLGIFHQFFRVYYFNLGKGLLSEFISAFLLAAVTVTLFLGIFVKVIGAVGGFLGVVFRLLLILAGAAVVIGIVAAIIYGISQLLKREKKENGQEQYPGLETVAGETVQREADESDTQGMQLKDSAAVKEPEKRKEKVPKPRNRKLWIPVIGGLCIMVLLLLVAAGFESEDTVKDLGMVSMGRSELTNFMAGSPDFKLVDTHTYSNQDGTVKIEVNDQGIPVYIDLKDDAYSFFSMKVGDQYQAGKTDTEAVRGHGYMVLDQTDSHVLYEAMNSPSYVKQFGVLLKDGRIWEIIYVCEAIEDETGEDESFAEEPKEVYEPAEADRTETKEQGAEVVAEAIDGYYECHSEYIDANVEIESGDVLRISLLGSSTDGFGSGEFHGTVTVQDGSNYIAEDEDGNIIEFYYDGAGTLEIRDDNYGTFGGISFPSFTGTYERSEERYPSEKAKFYDSHAEYFICDSDSRYLTDQEVSRLSQEDLRIAKNEIYARHGRIFTSEDLKAYFESKSWYEGTVPPDQFNESVFNPVEKANIQLIQSYIKN